MFSFLTLYVSAVDTMKCIFRWHLGKMRFYQNGPTEHTDLGCDDLPLIEAQWPDVSLPQHSSPVNILDVINAASTIKDGILRRALDR